MEVYNNVFGRMGSLEIMKKNYLIYTVILLGFILIVTGLFLAKKTTVVVLFKDQDNKIIYRERVKIGETVSNKIPTSKKEKVFVGWFLGKDEYDFTLPVNSNTVLIGRWEEKYNIEDTNTVSFYVDKNVYESQNVILNDLAIEPEKPTKENAQFLGWYLEDNPYNFAEPVVKDIKLVAKFKELPPKETNVENVIETPNDYPNDMFVKENDIVTDKKSIIMRASDEVIINASVLPENATIKNLQIYCENNDICYVDGDNKIHVVYPGKTNIILKSFHGTMIKVPITIKADFMAIREQDGIYFIIGSDYEKMSGTVTLRYQGETKHTTIYISKDTGIPVQGKIAEIINVVLDD